MWIITRDIIETESKGVRSKGYRESMPLKYDFRMLDDDENVYYEGKSSSESFAPLFAYGAPYAGCTAIQYKTSGKWITL